MPTLMSRLRTSLSILVIGSLTGCSPAAEPPSLPKPSQELTILEYKVKAGFLYNFAKLTEWATNAFATADAPVVVCVIGDDPFGKSLDDTLHGKTVGERKIVVQRFKHINEVGTCHILFISASERERLASIFVHIADKPILTVSDLENFARIGGMIGLRKTDDGPKFEINLHAVERAGLRLDSRLLRLAGIVTEGDPRPKERT